MNSIGLTPGYVATSLSSFVVGPLPEMDWRYEHPRRRGSAYFYARHHELVSGEGVLQEVLVGREHALVSLAESLKRARRLRDRARDRGRALLGRLRAVGVSYVSKPQGALRFVFSPASDTFDHDGWTYDWVDHVPDGADTVVAADAHAWEREVLPRMHNRYAILHNAFVCAVAQTLPPDPAQYHTLTKEVAGVRAFFAAVPDRWNRVWWRMFMPVEFFDTETPS